MVRPGETASDALQSASAFARSAPRRMWGVQALTAFGVAVMFAALRGRMSTTDAAELWRVGFWTLLVAAAPLWAGLYRLELGGRALRDLGPAGLQFGMAEARLIMLTGAFVGGFSFAWLPLVAISALIFILFRPLGAVGLPHVGDIQISFLIVSVLWLAMLAVFAYGCARCAFAPAASVGKRRLVLREAWDMGRGGAAQVMWSWCLAQAPAFLAVALLAFIDQLQMLHAAWGSAQRWPLGDAALAGLVLGVVVAFVQIPLTVGVLGHLYRARRDRLRTLTAPPAPPSPPATPAFRRIGFRPELLPG